MLFCSKLLVLLVLNIFLGSKVDASTITFKASPDEIKANLTKALSMRCELTDNVQSGPSPSAPGVRHVSSIYVTRNNGEDVAFVTSYDPPTALSDLGNLEVKGSVSAVSGEGFLELSWSRVDLVTLGEYSCDVTAIDTRGHTVVIKSNFELLSVAPSIGDVIVDLKETQTIVAKQQNRIDAQDKEITILKQQDTLKNQRLKNQSADIMGLKTCTSHYVAFMATISNGVLDYHMPVIYDKVIVNTGGNYNPTNGTFICQTPGVYAFSAHAISLGGHYVCLNLKLNSETMSSVYAYDDTHHDSGSASAVLRLKYGDVVHVDTAGCSRDNVFYNDGNIKQPDVFTGFLLHSDACV